MLIRLAVVAVLVTSGVVAGPTGVRGSQQPGAPVVQAPAGSEAADTQPAADPRTVVDPESSAAATVGTSPTREFGLDRSTTEPDQTWQLLLALFGLVLVIAAGLFAHQHLSGGRRRDPEFDAGGERSLPPIVFPARTGVEHMAATAPAAHGTHSMQSNLAGEPTSAARTPSSASTRPAPTAQAARANPPARTSEANGTGSLSKDIDAGETATGQSVQSGPIRFHRPPEGTLQLLPGRLQIVSDNERQEEIRFVKVSGQDPAITFGRSEGRPHLHIQLESPTVSRMHATIRYRDGSWYLSNLSKTNPVIVNERELGEVPSPQVELADGDRIEMGEVVFRFRSRG